jgi:hypothetical protein
MIFGKRSSLPPDIEATASSADRYSLGLADGVVVVAACADGFPGDGNEGRLLE